MTLFNFNNNIIVWSPFPYCDETEDCLRELVGTSNYHVTHLIVPNCEHTLGIKSFKEKFPDSKVIAVAQFNNLNHVDYTIPPKYGNKVIDGDMMRQIGINDDIITNNFIFAAIAPNRIGELVVYEKTSKLLFVGDILLNLYSYNQPLEQYSEPTGWPQNRSPFSGISWFGKFIKPNNFIWRHMMQSIYDSSDKSNQEGIKAIYGLDFTTVVPCHGNVVEDGKREFREFYRFL